MTAFTLSLDTPQAMREQAALNAHRPVLKIKLGTPDDMPRLEAVRQGALRSTILIDANDVTREVLAARLRSQGYDVEPVPDGDNTRRLVGSGAGFFVNFNRNKKSLAIDLRSPQGRAAIDRLRAAITGAGGKARAVVAIRLRLGCVRCFWSSKEIERFSRFHAPGLQCLAARVQLASSGFTLPRPIIWRCSRRCRSDR